MCERRRDKRNRAENDAGRTGRIGFRCTGVVMGTMPAVTRVQFAERAFGQADRTQANKLAIQQIARHITGWNKRAQQKQGCQNQQRDWFRASQSVGHPKDSISRSMRPQLTDCTLSVPVAPCESSPVTTSATLIDGLRLDSSRAQPAECAPWMNRAPTASAVCAASCAARGG